MLEDCIARIIRATNSKLTKNEVGDIMEMILRYAQNPKAKKVFGPFSPEQGRVQEALENAPKDSDLSAARDTIIARARLIAAQQQANRAMNAVKLNDRLKMYEGAPSYHLGAWKLPLSARTPAFPATGFQPKRCKLRRT